MLGLKLNYISNGGQARQKGIYPVFHDLGK